MLYNESGGLYDSQLPPHVYTKHTFSMIKFSLFFFSVLFLAFLSFSCSDDSDNSDPEPVKYTVTFNTNGGSAISSQIVESGKTVAEPTAPIKDSSIFAGWYSDSALTTKFSFSTKITADTTLYAKWTEIPSGSFAVIFNSNGGSSAETQIVADGNAATEPSVIWAMHSFDGWFTDSDLTQQFDFSTPITQTITLYAKWTSTATNFTFNLTNKGGYKDVIAAISGINDDAVTIAKNTTIINDTESGVVVTLLADANSNLGSTINAKDMIKQPQFKYKTQTAGLGVRYCGVEIAGVQGKVKVTLDWCVRSAIPKDAEYMAIKVGNNAVKSVGNADTTSASTPREVAQTALTDTYDFGDTAGKIYIGSTITEFCIRSVTIEPAD